MQLNHFYEMPHDLLACYDDFSVFSIHEAAYREKASYLNLLYVARFRARRPIIGPNCNYYTNVTVHCTQAYTCMMYNEPPVRY